MSECVVKITKPLVCITKDGYYGNCQMDRVWCIQRNAPKGITMGEAYAAMTDNVPSWCPIICQLPEGHGRLVDADAMEDDARRLWDYTTVDGITASTVLKQIMTDIGNCPTIVPAEAERSEHERTD